MKKKFGMLLGTAIAALGVVGSVGVSYALYKKVANPVSINIGTYTPTTDAFVYRLSEPSVTKSMAEATVGTDYTVSQPAHAITFDLGGEYPTAQGVKVIAQPFYVGYLTIEISCTAVGTKYVTDAMTVTSSLAYKDANLKQTFDDKGKVTAGAFWVNTLAETKTTGKITLAGLIAMQAASSNSVDVRLDIAFNLEDDALALANSYSVKITLDEAKESNGMNWLYTRGGSIGWAASSDYRLVPNLGKSTAEFMFKNFPGSFGEMKIATEDWSTAVASAQDGGNFTPQHADKDYEIYWHGDISGSKTLSESENSGIYYINAE